MTKKVADFLNGNVNSYIRIVFMALLLGLGGFLFHQATSLPSTFATKDEVRTVQTRMEVRLDRIESKVDDINKFLRKRNARFANAIPI